MTLKDATRFWALLSFGTKDFPTGLRWLTKFLAIGWFVRVLVRRAPQMFAIRVPPPPPPTDELEDDA